MPKSLSWLGLVLLAGLPVIVLATYALLGLHAERRAILADAHDEGRRVVGEIGRALDTAIERALEDVSPTPLYPVNPVPASPNTEQEHFNTARLEGDIATLKKLRDDDVRTTSLSQAGMPIRALAAWEVFALEPDPVNRSKLREIVLHETPSIMTPVLLERAGVDDWQKPWQRDEDSRALLHQWHEQVPAISEAGPLGEENRLCGWVHHGNDGLRVLSRAELDTIIENALTFPRSDWMSVRVHYQKDILHPRDGDPLPESNLVLGRHDGSLRTQTVLAHPDRLLAPYHRRRQWTLGTIALATLASGMGLVLTHLALRRERRLNALKSQFVASVSHELRSPVASMRLMAEALASGKVSDVEKVRTFQRLMAGEGARLSALVENVLDFARIEQGRKTYNVAETDVEALLRDAVALLEPQAKAKDITLDSEFETLSFTPVVDSLAVQQAVINLLDNAIKFSPAKTTITLRLREHAGKKEGAWSISITDEGPGIALQDQQRIFDRFTRLENELRRETQGAGIGLSLVKHVVEGHGGRVTVKSVPGKGSTFALEFPPPDKTSTDG